MIKPEDVNGKPTLRVLQVFGGLGMGGAETWLMSLLRYFRDAEDTLPFKIKTDICLTSGVKGELDDEAIKLGATLHYIRYGRKDLVAFARRFRKLLADNDFDVIHDHQDYSAGIHFLLALDRLPPVRIAHVHNAAYRLTEHRDRLSKVVGAAGKRILELVNAKVTGTSEKLLTEYGFDVDEHRKGSTRAVYCGFDVNPYKDDQTQCRDSLRSEFGWDPSNPVILFVGRLAGGELTTAARSHKNPMFALDVFTKSFARRSDLRILFVGEKGNLYDYLQAATNERDLTDVVKFIGIRSDIPRLMLGSDLLLFPSSSEGLGMVAVEAQAAGLRVLASDAVPSECVVDPSLVRFLSLEMGTDAWTDELLNLIELPKPDQVASSRLIEASRFSIATSARELIELYSGQTQTQSA